jgi:hypothetical protein
MHNKHWKINEINVKPCKIKIEKKCEHKKFRKK